MAAPTPILGDLTRIPEHLPGEPLRVGRSGVVLLSSAVVRLLLMGLLAKLLSPFWLLYGLLALAYGRAPNVARAAQFRRYLAHAWGPAAPHPGTSLGRRIWLTSEVLRKLAGLPFWASAWHLDELFYGRQLDAVELKAPLFEISAARSGSTQLARYLEEDPHLVAPSLLQAAFPYRWLWQLVRATLGRVVTPDWVRGKLEGALPPEFVQRHELDPFLTDTFDVAILGAHLNFLALPTGPHVAGLDFSMGRAAPWDHGMWEEDAPRIIDRLGRKLLLEAGPGHRLFVKGHFLAAAQALAVRFPDARFLTVVRRPSARLQSAINYMRVNPGDGALGPIPWAWLTESLLKTEMAYNEDELAWFAAPGPTRRCVVRFDDYVRDLGGTLDRVYAECLDGTPPARLPRAHPARQRTGYLVDRSLAQLEVDGAALDAANPEYLRWATGG